MHKEVKNDKVLRAITVGIAAMMASSAMPVTVLADENPDTPDNTVTEAPSESHAESAPEGGSSSESNVSSESSESSQNTQEVAAVQTAVNEAASQAEGASVLISDAIDAVTSETLPIMDQEVVTNLSDAEFYIDGNATEDGAVDQVEKAQGFIDLAAKAEGTAETFAGSADQVVNETNTATGTFKKAKKETTEKADETIGNAETANTSKFEKEAYKAKDKAIKNLELVEKGFEEANNAYQLAHDKAEQAEQEYKFAEDQHKEALRQVELAKEQLLKAQENSAAAIAALKAAEERAGSLERRVEKLEETSEQLEAIRTQYYAMMVQYYQDVLGIDNAVYNKDGSLNIEASAAKITKEQINAKSTNPKDVMLLGRDLMKKLVEYQVMTDENVDFEKSEFAFAEYEKGLNGVEARQGIVFESDKIVKDENGKNVVDEDGNPIGKDQVVINQDGKNGRKDGRKDIDGKKIVAKDGYTLYQEKSKNDNGRTNRFKLTYKDKDGEVHTTYYNYVFKNSNYLDSLEGFESGPIYLAEVEKTTDENGNEVWVAKRSLNENNFDNYQDVLKAIEAIQVLDEYKSAQEAVKAAREQVETLDEQLKALKDVSVDSSKITELKEKLDQAKQDLAEQEAEKAALAQKVKDAEDAVASIDLSRFDRSDAPAEDAGEDTSSGTTGTTTPGAAYTAPVEVSIPAVPAAVAPGTLTGTTAGGATLADFTDVAGVRAGEEAVQEQTSPIAEAMEAVADTRTAGAQEVVDLEDADLAGAASADVADREGMNLWWLLIVTLLGATGTAMYEKHKEKAEARRNHPEA